MDEGSSSWTVPSWRSCYFQKLFGHVWTRNHRSHSRMSQTGTLTWLQLFDRWKFTNRSIFLFWRSVCVCSIHSVQDNRLIRRKPISGNTVVGEATWLSELLFPREYIIPLEWILYREHKWWWNPDKCKWEGEDTEQNWEMYNFETVQNGFVWESCKESKGIAAKVRTNLKYRQ